LTDDTLLTLVNYINSQYSKTSISVSYGEQAFRTLYQDKILNGGCVKIKHKSTTVVKTKLHSH